MNNLSSDEVLSDSLKTPIGTLSIQSRNGAITHIEFHGKNKQGNSHPPQADHDSMKTVIQQINEYFAGQRTTFTLPLHVEGTPFQRKVWKLLLAIPYGETLSYSEIAKKLGNPNAARAVGMACRHNPIPIIIPCHRVVAKDGSLGGFSLGGVGVKRILRQLEQCHCWARIQKNT